MHFRVRPGEILEQWDALDYALLAQRYLKLPFGEERWQLAILAATVANSNPFRDEDQPLVTPWDALPPVPQEPQRAQPIDEAIDNVKQLCAALNGGKVKRD